MSELELGQMPDGLKPEALKNLQDMVSNAIKSNEENMHTMAGAIQRRGQNVPGDVGQNFGLNDQFGQIGQFGILDMYSDLYTRSQGIGGSYGGFGGGLQLYGSLGQGSHAAFRRNTKIAHQKMAVCVSAYKGFGLAKNVIDLMSNFAAEGLKIKHPNKVIEKFLNRWAFHVSLQNRVKDMLRYYYKYGNVFIYRTMGAIDNDAYLKLRRSKATMDNNLFETVSVDIDPVDNPSQTERQKIADKESKKPIGKRLIPWRYTFLNPFQMELRGTKVFGEQRWIFILDQDTVTNIRNQKVANRNSQVDFLEETKINLPAEFVNLSKKKEKDTLTGDFNDDRVINLNQDNLYTMHYMKDDHEDWADPLLWPVMADIYYKNKLRQMDISVCNSVINAITIFKLGDLKNGYVPSKEHLDKFSEFLRAPTQAMQMVWNDAIDIVDSFPPVDKILGLAKYESVDKDILRGVGIPEILIGGAGGNFSNGFLGVRTLLERLEEGRNTVMRWLTLELQLLVETLGIRNSPTIRFGKMSLRDEKAEKQLVLQLLDRNIISIGSVLETFGEDIEIELERLKEEERIREDTGMLQKHSPYVDPINDLDLEEQLKKEADFRMQEKKMDLNIKKKEKRNAVAPNGRPPGTDGIPQSKKRETKPKGMAYFVEYEKARKKYLKLINDVEDMVSNYVVQVKGRKNRRELTKEDQHQINLITLAVSSQLNIDRSPSKEDVLNVLGNSPKIPGHIYSAYSSLEVEDKSNEDRKIAMATAMIMNTIWEVDDADW